MGDAAVASISDGGRIGALQRGVIVERGSRPHNPTTARDQTKCLSEAEARLKPIETAPATARITAPLIAVSRIIATQMGALPAAW
jgi:hypothetical protein